MGVSLNVPQTSDAVPTPSLAQVFLSEIHTQGNLYKLLLSNPRSLRVENFSTAPLMLQLFPVGSAAPFVFTINPGGVEQLTGKVPYDRCQVSNLTDFPLPYGGIGQSGGAIVTGYVQIAGLDSDMTIQAGSPVPASAANPTTVTILGTVPVSGAVTVPAGVAVTNTPNVGVPAGVAVTNTPNVGVPAGVAVTNTPDVAIPGGTAINGNVPVVNPSAGSTLRTAGQVVNLGFTSAHTLINQVLTDVYSIDPSWGSLFIGNGNALGTAIARVRVLDNAIILADFNPMPAFSRVVVPLLTGNASVSIEVTSGSTIGGSVSVIATQDPAFVVPSNFGNSPLIVQPASGSSQTVIPGTAASTIFQEVSASLGTPVTITFGAIFNRPTAIYMAQMSFYFVYGTTNNPSGGPDLSCTVEIGVQGQQTNTFLPLGYLSGGGAVVLNGTLYTSSISGYSNIVFPFPLAGATLLPGDTTVKAYQKAWANGYPSANVFSALNLLAS